MFYEKMQSLDEGNSLVKIRPHLIFGDFTLSTQAGPFVYSQPRENLQDLSLYESWEIAILFEDSLEHPSALKEILSEEVYEILMNIYDDHDNVASYVPTPLVQELYEAFVRNYGQPIVSNVFEF